MELFPKFLFLLSHYSCIGMQGISVCWFYILQLYYIHWWALGGVFRVFHVEDHVICKQWEFYFFFSNVDSFYSFFSQTAVAKTSKTMLNSSGETGHLCLVPDFRGNAFNVSPLRIMFAVGYHIWLLLCWGMFLLCAGRFFTIQATISIDIHKGIEKIQN